jgi:hypothetical protein
VALRHNSAQTNLTRFAVQAEGMVTKRVNDTDPVIQVRLRVTLGNFRGAHRVRLVAGSVYHEHEFSKHNQHRMIHPNRHAGGFFNCPRDF